MSLDDLLARVSALEMRLVIHVRPQGDELVVTVQSGYPGGPKPRDGMRFPRHTKIVDAIDAVAVKSEGYWAATERCSGYEPIIGEVAIAEYDHLMCNLYRVRSSVDELRRMVGAFDGDRSNFPTYDAIYPNQEAPILRRDDGKLTLETHIWGVPPFGNVKRPITNVRNLKSNFWRNMLTKPERRCLVPVSEFCEWEGEKGSKRKVWFGMKDEAPFSFAGVWRPTDDGPRMAFLTTDPNEIVGAVHPKAMPVILPRDGYDVWLDADWDEAQGLVGPYPDDEMVIVEKEG